MSSSIAQWTSRIINLDTPSVPTGRGISLQYKSANLPVHRKDHQNTH
jgi:hypothetical protein